MKPKSSGVAEMRAEYDFSNGVRGKYHKRLAKEGSNVVVLDPDVAKAFPDSASVNEALRVVLKAGRAARRLATRSGGPVKVAGRNEARRWLEDIFEWTFSECFTTRSTSRSISCE